MVGDILLGGLTQS